MCPESTHNGPNPPAFDTIFRPSSAKFAQTSTGCDQTWLGIGQVCLGIGNIGPTKPDFTRVRPNLARSGHNSNNHSPETADGGPISTNYGPISAQSGPGGGGPSIAQLIAQRCVGIRFSSPGKHPGHRSRRRRQESAVFLLRRTSKARPTDRPSPFALDPKMFTPRGRLRLRGRGPGERLLRQRHLGEERRHLGALRMVSRLELGASGAGVRCLRPV